MSVGTYLSGVGHAALLIWMVAGWGMSVDPLPFEITEVSVVSGEDFAAMTQGVQPELPPDAPQAPEQPPVEDTPPAPEPAAEPPQVVEAPAPVEAPVAETPPEAPDLTVPETVVTDAPPDVPQTPQIITPPPSAELGTSARPVPRPAPRVAPEIIEAPEPDATVAPEVAEAATEQPEAPVEEEVVEPEEETTAPEAAADEIVTEAEDPAFAPEISRRPQTRPNRPAPAVEAPTEEVVDPVAAALAEAVANDTAASEPDPAPTPTPGVSGGQLSEGDKAGFLRQIGRCWNLGAASTGAQNTIIVMSFSMTPDAKPVSDSFDLVSFTDGTAADAQIAFDAARRAIIRCTSDGYDLPREQYNLWQYVELTVDPTAMRQR
ncbi:cell envelope biogenesis protein TolA [Thalassorhabdomicrobium marinisediminis]|uniref:Cell envelope biogenesis protein TolA n=1 Tax=Thalassorhabdomicrobium marinisediminis TaxID=2170577 RepID=A0A2T7FUH5_9RHOB|nr:cell envelope biogenesis protein TolA [Thalassorhabdomicrobium marinisediminis]PVA05808.1 cell envelope biogenesis protein TolA [Thalassorhabdomicrobium marinisediminis]